jgi:hypothetical protein
MNRTKFGFKTFITRFLIALGTSQISAINLQTERWTLNNENNYDIDNDKTKLINCNRNPINLNFECLTGVLARAKQDGFCSN